MEVCAHCGRSVPIANMQVHLLRCSRTAVARPASPAAGVAAAPAAPDVVEVVRCGHCSFESDADAERCACCGREVQWACSICTYLNPVERGRCEMCDRQRREGGAADGGVRADIDEEREGIPMMQMDALDAPMQTILQSALASGSVSAGMSMLRGERGIEGVAQGALLGGALGLVSLLVAGGQRAALSERERGRESLRRRHAMGHAADSAELEALVHRLFEEQQSAPSVPPASSVAVAACPTGAIGEADLRCEDKSCAICLEDYGLGDEYRRLPCLHRFHTGCIDHWLRGSSAVCPVCKTPIR